MRRLSAQWCVQMNGFIFGTCVLLSYQSHPYKESALIAIPMESWRGYETVECTTLIFLEVNVRISSRNDAPLRIAQDIWNRFPNWSPLLVTDTAVCLEKTEKFCLIELTCKANFLIVQCLDTRWVLHRKQRWEERFHYKRRVSIKHICAKVSSSSCVSHMRTKIIPGCNNTSSRTCLH